MNQEITALRRSERLESERVGRKKNDDFQRNHLEVVRVPVDNRVRFLYH